MPAPRPTPSKTHLDAEETTPVPPSPPRLDTAERVFTISELTHEIGRLSQQIERHTDVTREHMRAEEQQTEHIINIERALISLEKTTTARLNHLEEAVSRAVAASAARDERLDRHHEQLRGGLQTVSNWIAVHEQEHAARDAHRTQLDSLHEERDGQIQKTALDALQQSVEAIQKSVEAHQKAETALKGLAKMGLAGAAGGAVVQVLRLLIGLE